MGVECPYHARCSLTSIEPDQVTAASKVLREAVGEGVSATKCTWEGESWETTDEAHVIPLKHLNAVNTVCHAGFGGFYPGRVYFEGDHPTLGQIGGMVVEDGVFALEYAASEQGKCLRFLHFAHNGTVQELQEV